jgi:hypothetical protein
MDGLFTMVRSVCADCGEGGIEAQDVQFLQGHKVLQCNVSESEEPLAKAQTRMQATRRQAMRRVPVQVATALRRLSDLLPADAICK